MGGDGVCSVDKYTTHFGPCVFLSPSWEPSCFLSVNDRDGINCQGSLLLKQFAWEF